MTSYFYPNSNDKHLKCFQSRWSRASLVAFSGLLIVQFPWLHGSVYWHNHYLPLHTHPLCLIPAAIGFRRDERTGYLSWFLRSCGGLRSSDALASKRLRSGCPLIIEESLLFQFPFFKETLHLQPEPSLTVLRWLFNCLCEEDGSRTRESLRRHSLLPCRMHSVPSSDCAFPPLVLPL